MKKKKYWAGFCDDCIAETLDKYSDRKIASIYFRKEDAQKDYEDVRPVEIKKVKR